LTDLAFNAQFTTMPLSHMLGDRQAQAGATGLTGAAAVNPVKPL
jgi:hypothetical protein